MQLYILNRYLNIEVYSISIVSSYPFALKMICVFYLKDKLHSIFYIRILKYIFSEKFCSFFPTFILGGRFLVIAFLKSEF